MLRVKETLDEKTFDYQITNEFGEAQPFTALNLYRHVGYPMRVMQTTTSSGSDAVINLTKRYLPLTLIWYGEQRLREFYAQNGKKIVTAYAASVEKVLRAYRRFNEKAEFCRTPETQAMVEADRNALVPMFGQELAKFYFTALNKTNAKWRDETVRNLFVELLAERILVRMVIEDTLSLKMEVDGEATDLDNAQAKALTALCGHNTVGVANTFKLYNETLKDLSTLEVNILFAKLQTFLGDVAEEEMARYEERKAAKAAEEKAKADEAAREARKPANARAGERAKDPNRRGKTVKAKREKPRERTMDESLAALQAKFNRM